MSFTEMMSHLVRDFNAYALLIGTMIIFVLYLIWNEHREGKLNWSDLITSKGTNRVSLTKFLQLVGGMVSTWVIMYHTLHNVLSTEMFFTYLAYVGAIEGWSKFVSAKYNFQASEKKQEP